MTTFRYSEQHRNEYYGLGLTVLRDLVPAALLSDLRRETETARKIARQQNGPQAQRLQPVYRYDALNHQPFRDFLALDGLQATVAGILGPAHTPSDLMGVLFEPERDAWATPWHRDWGDNVPGIDRDAFFAAALHQPQMFNQLNAALYDDHSLWIVPGSHDRLNSDAERAAFDNSVSPPGPPLSPEMSPEEREMACRAYARKMPGATPVTLASGDVAFYRSVGWHIGNYVPYTKRATLHDGFFGPEDRAWQANVPRKANA